VRRDEDPCSLGHLLKSVALGASLIATQGFATPEAGETYIRARHLCAHVDDPHQLFPVLRGRWNYYHVRAEHQTAHALGEQLLTLAQQHSRDRRRKGSSSSPRAGQRGMLQEQRYSDHIVWRSSPKHMALSGNQRQDSWCLRKR
jgi:hypothetical protein